VKHRSVALPIVLIGLGALFLIDNAMPDVHVWTLLAGWWPLVLIAFGVIQLIEVLALYGTGRARSGFTQSGYTKPMGFGWIFVLILIVAAAVLPAKLRSHFKWDTRSLVSFFGEDYDFPVSAETGVGDAKHVVLDQMRGGVTINGSNRSDIQLDGHKTIRASDKDAASKINDESLVTFTRDGDTIFIRAAEPSTQAHISIDMEISMPNSMSVEARGRNGDLTVNSISGDVDVTSQKGDIRLQDIGGSAKIEQDHGDLVRATGVKGPIDVQGSGGDIQLERVGGQVTINGRFSGTLDFKELEKSLHFESKETDFRVEKLPGTISLSLSELHGTNVSGPIRLVAHERDVNLDDFSGPVDIEIGHGDVGLKPSTAAALARIDVRTRGGNIEMALPADKPFDLKATAQHGEVSNDYGDGIVSESGPGRSNSLHNTNPSGAAISLITERGEISARKLD
jgi:hypothetical protein